MSIDTFETAKPRSNAGTNATRRINEKQDVEVDVRNANLTGAKMTAQRKGILSAQAPQQWGKAELGEAGHAALAGARWESSLQD
eukprot:gene14263-16869_t